MFVLLWVRPVHHNTLDRTRIYINILTVILAQLPFLYAEWISVESISTSSGPGEFDMMLGGNYSFSCDS